MLKCRQMLRSLAPVALLLAAACAQETVAHQQPEREANHILVKLRNGGVDASKLRSEGARDLVFDILVPGEDTATALRILEDNNLPKAARKGTEKIFGEGGGMIPTSEQERAKRIAGVEGDIVNSIRSIPQVISVEAAVSIPKEDPLRDVNVERPRPKASVIILYVPDSSGTPPISIEEVQRHVQAKLPEMKSPEVNVLLLPASPDKVAAAAGGEETPVAAPIDPAVGCAKKERVLGIDVCQGEKKKVLNGLVGSVVVAFLLAGLSVVAILRAMKYRKDLTRLTAQFQQHRQ